MGYQPIGKPPLTHFTPKTKNKRTQTSIPVFGFEPTTPAFSLLKTVYLLDSEATVVGSVLCIFFANAYRTSRSISHVEGSEPVHASQTRATLNKRLR
jgi:hypothetical protein